VLAGIQLISLFLFINGEAVAEGRVDKTQPVIFSADETVDVGQDDATQVVSIFKNTEDSKFSGYVSKVEVSIYD